MFTFLKENQLHVAIPEQGSLSNSIMIHREGVIKDIKVNLDISHPFIGDISVKIASPSGKVVTLRKREGGAADDISTIYSGEILQEFIGEQAKGLWTLIVADHATRDSGTLDSWGIEVDCDEFKSHPIDIYIPNGGTNQMLYSTQECRFDGRVTKAVVDAEIEHPLIGDLVVSIVSPEGREVVLHDRIGGSQNHLNKQWSGDAMTGLIGATTKGTWGLKIQNFHNSDSGALKHWKIKFHYEKEDDLKIIEGIGPKIDEVLKNGGIYSFSALATTSVGKIKSILEAAGDRFKLADPATWPKQAGLAALGKWDDLNIYKALLDGGREPND